MDIMLKCFYCDREVPASAWPLAFLPFSAYHNDYKGWLIETVEAPTSRGCLYALCPEHSKFIRERILL